MDTSLRLAIAFSMITAISIPIVGVDAQDKSEAKQQSAIVIVGQDGEKVDGSQLKIELDDGVGQLRSSFGNPGKLIIIGKDGEKKELDVSDAKSVVISKSVNSTNNHGDQEIKVDSRAIVVDEDGVRNEYKLFLQPGEGGPETAEFFFEEGDLGGLMGRLRGQMPGIKVFSGDRNGRPQVFRFESGPSSKFMIGVFCRNISEDLQSHLDLEKGMGLIVDNVSDELPAAKAGLKKHDILMYADKNELKSVNDLVAAIEKAGAKDRDVSLTVIRSGKELTLNVKPTPRTNTIEMDEDGLFRQFNKLQMNEVGPGLIIDEDVEAGDGDFRAEFERMQREMQKTMEEMKRLHQQMRKRLPSKSKDNNSDEIDL